MLSKLISFRSLDRPPGELLTFDANMLRPWHGVHIIPDTEPEGEPVVRNGISLCRLHHAAFGRFFLAVRPDHIIEVRPDVLEEIDGPTLQHAIQGLHGQPIVLPRKLVEQPAIEFLSERYDRFLEVVNAR
jgi:putative restriction endonuclease